MNFMNKLEKKFGKYAIHDLINYIIVLYIVGFVIMTANPSIYTEYLTLDISKVLEGQVWRLFTFIIQPPQTNPLFLFFELYFYYIVGHSLENNWGAFRFNLFFFSGMIFNILATVLMYYILGISIPIGLTFINRSMFFAYATLYPNVEMLFMYIIPIKLKYLAYFYGAYMLYDVFQYFRYSPMMGLVISIYMIVSLTNFLIYFLSTRNYRRISPREIKRKSSFKKQVKQATSGTLHKCAVCGRTELDDENLEFRFCSKCDGNYEYCMEHLFTHEHVHLK